MSRPTNAFSHGNFIAKPLGTHCLNLDFLCFAHKHYTQVWPLQSGTQNSFSFLSPCYILVMRSNNCQLGGNKVISTIYLRFSLSLEMSLHNLEVEILVWETIHKTNSMSTQIQDFIKGFGDWIGGEVFLLIIAYQSIMI